MKRSSRPPFVTAIYEECRADAHATTHTTTHTATHTATGATTNVTHQSAQLASCLGVDGTSQHFTCDLCGKSIEGSPSGSGLLLWHRGDEMRIDEPPLCERCASRVTIGAAVKWALEGEEES